MNSKNCPNCGAPYNPHLNKCPYCGTSYYDMSGIDFTDHKPFYLKIKININNTPCYMTQLVRPSLNSMEISSDDIYCYDGKGNTLMNFATHRNLTTNINFEAITDRNENLMTITTEN